MRKTIFSKVSVVILGILLLCGCQKHVKNEQAVGTVVEVNSAAKYVVLSVAQGHSVTNGTRLNLYRANAKVAAIRVTGPQNRNAWVCQIVSGEPKKEDEARRD